jgi:hypothetical protein
MNSTNETPVNVTAKKDWSEPVLTSLSVPLDTFAIAATGGDAKTAS